MPEKVVVIGGGVAGLTAAHELIERGFEVHLYERRQRLGGKSASVTTPDGFPGEHGFRFFPGWYRHVPDTMRRIPYKHRSVADNLVDATESLFASYLREPIPAILRFPRSLRDVVTLAGFPEHMLRIGLTPADFLFFFGKLAQFAASPESLRLSHFETQSWWQFMEAEQRSEQFRAYLVDGITRNTVAASPRQASAYTIATVALRTMMDVGLERSVDRVLNGPTSEVWIDPWVQHLVAKGVTFHCDSELESIELDGPKIKAVSFLIGGLEIRQRRARLEYMRACLEPHYPPQALQQLHAKVVALGGDPSMFQIDRADCDDAADSLEACLRRSDSGSVEAKYFVFALPIEQMAYYVNRSEMLKRKDPSLTNIVRLSNHVEWMAGIQFYLTKDVQLTHGHVDCLDSEWSLTAISQAQFWSEVDFSERGNGQYRDKVKTILSVDISAWNVKGGARHEKEAFSCTREEIAEEVWAQLKKSLNRPNSTPVLTNEHLLGRPAKDSAVLPACSYYLDEQIIDRFDRKKQAFYKQYESVRFSSEAVAERALEQKDPPTLFAHGDRLSMNAEPLFVNRAGTLHMRPCARTKIENMFLAADYVRTNTNLATMEAANEAGRQAVNEILTVSGSQQPPCRIWSLAPATDALSGIASFVTQPGFSSNGSGVRPSAVSVAAGLLQGTARRAFDSFTMRRR